MKSTHLLLLFFSFNSSLQTCLAEGLNSDKNWQESVDQFFGDYLVSPLISVLFWKIPGLENNTLQPFVEIQDNVVLWSGNHIGHHSIIRNNCFLSSHVVISGHCDIGENAFFGVNSTVANNIKIASDNFISMGASISKQTDEDGFYTGNPAEKRKVSAKRVCKVKE